MAQIRMQVRGINAGAPDRDAVSNTFYLDTDLGDPGGTGGTNYETLAQDAADLFATSIVGATSEVDTIEVRAYDMGDALPRQPRAVKTANAPGNEAPGPRDVCVCLSYYADRNLPRKRGRMFLGPIPKSAMDLRVPAAIRTGIAADLGEGISGLGGINVQWVQYSPTSDTYSNVTDYYIDNEWDTQRSRGLRPDARTTGEVNG